MRLTTSLASAASLTLAAFSFAGPAHAGGYGYDHGWGYHDNAGAAIFGFAAGAIMAGAFAPRYYGHAPYGYYDQPHYYHPNFVYAAPPRYYAPPPYYGEPPIYYDGGEGYFYSEPFPAPCDTCGSRK